MDTIAPRELILGGQKSGKSRRAETLAAHWLRAQGGRAAILLATAQAADEEMRARIARHRAERAQRVPELQTLEVGAALSDAVCAHSAAQTLLVIDCLTLWLIQWCCPAPPAQPADAARVAHAIDALCAALQSARGPVVIVSNEIGLGVIPFGAATRSFVDTLGMLNQRVAQLCERVTLMVAGMPLAIKDDSCAT